MSRTFGRVLGGALLVALVLAYSAGAQDPQPEGDDAAVVALTDNAALERFLGELVGKFERGPGQWNFEFEGMKMAMFSDQARNRMRIVTPVVEIKGLGKKDLLTLLEANFDRALDAKYAIFRDVVWSTYVHPLAELGREEFENGLRQVATLRANYGTTYTSTDVVFGGGVAAPPTEED